MGSLENTPFRPFPPAGWISEEKQSIFFYEAALVEPALQGGGPLKDPVGGLPLPPPREVAFGSLKHL